MAATGTRPIFGGGFLCDGVNPPFTVQALTFSRGKAGSGGARRAELEARVNQLVLMATPSGRWVLPASDEFLGALGDPNPDYDAPGFAVRNLGFVRLRVLGHTLIEIELHPRNVAERALQAAIGQIVKAEAALFRIKYFRGGWQSEIAASAGDAVSRLEELCAPATRPAPASRFEVEPRHPAGSGEWEKTPRVETPSSHGIRFRQTLR